MIKIIEKSTIELAEKLAKLEKNLFESAWDCVVINNKINNGEFVYWVFEQDNQIVGYLAIQKTFFDIHILGIGVLESHRNNSIAKSLTQELISYNRLYFIELVGTFYELARIILQRSKLFCLIRLVRS